MGLIVQSSGAVKKLKSFGYKYELGGSQEHVNKAEKILPPDPRLKGQVCVANANACPAEDSVGGPMGDEEVLKAINTTGYSGHSLRAGLIPSAARAAVSLHKIMEQSGHRFVQILTRYIRDAQLFEGNAVAAVV